MADTQKGELKNSTVIDDHVVIKTFIHGHNSLRRFHREQRALRRLATLDGFPRLERTDRAHRKLYIERLPGAALSVCEHVPESCLVSLRVGWRVSHKFAGVCSH